MSPFTKVQFTIPREHGAYILLIASWLWGMIYSAQVHIVPSILILGVAAQLFLAQESFRRSFRNKTWSVPIVALILLVLALAAGIVLLVLSPRVLYLLGPAVVLIGLYFLMVRTGIGLYLRSVLGFILLSLLTPATLIANGAADYSTVFVIWLGVACFATSSVLVVGIRLGEKNAQRRALIFHAMYLAAAILYYYLLPAALLSLVAIALIAIARWAIVSSSVTRYRTLSLKTIGLLESIVTAIALAASALT